MHPADDERNTQLSRQREERAELRARRQSFFANQPFTWRGLGVLSAGVIALLLAAFLGRRELLAIALFLIVVPLVSAITVHWGRGQLKLERTFAPHPVTAGETTRVSSRVRFPRPRGAAVVVEDHLPDSFGANPRFLASPQDASGFSYRVRPSQRGTHTVGPATALTVDVLGLARRRVKFGEVSALCVLPRTNLFDAESSSGAHFSSGLAPTARQSSPDMDDVMTREYREGDPLRRIHWPASARHGELMVRQEVFSVRHYVAIVVDAAASSYGLGTDQGEASSEATSLRTAPARALSVPRFGSDPGVTSELFDRTVELAATLVTDLHQQGVTVDVFEHTGRTLNEGSHSARGYISRMGPDSVQWCLSELGVTSIEVGHAAPELPVPDSQSLMVISGNPTREHAERLTTWLSHYRTVNIALPHRGDSAAVFENAGWTIHELNSAEARRS
ncbi:DUF58 domain-containing protein [Neomicrococcus aestuarii]|uniref:DUF58 domain-containing protein n=1 Tax=Neomicrococcus aestuarii TaxID=556325 RepID=A0A1L2ZN88_9MICC|nr:DUF58 domain-containing protein [Neomicrococcus aestuarii]APF40491.1 hypothetical protein BHE16_05040 [Neomicrococcus aestuarii]